MPHRRVETDVIVVGLGPTGLMATAFLTKLGISVCAIEKHETLYGLPRAGHVDHEIVRYLQELGVSNLFLDDAFPVSSYRWYNASQELLLEMDWGGMSASGFNADYMMYQPVLEDALVEAVARHNAKLAELRGYAVSNIVQDAEGVTVNATRVRMIHGQEQLDIDECVTVRGRYLIAADGARSQARESLGISRDDLGFNETWLDCDVRVKRPLPAMDPHQICDPSRPIFISPLGKRHHRFEWAILPGEDPFNFTSAETAWELLAKLEVGPNDVEIVRQQVYTFEARVALNWRAARILLLGDAAHTMPPHMGQGACSGMRDAVNVAWKLSLVLAGVAGDALLDSYQTEREPHTRTWTDLSIRAGEVSCTLDPAAAVVRDALWLSGQAPSMPPFPSLTTGIVDARAGAAALPPVGQLFPQRAVQSSEGAELIDDVAGAGFRLIVLDRSVLASLPAAQREVLDRLYAHEVVIGRESGSGCLGDIDSFYHDWMASHGALYVLVRPDHYVYGVSATAERLCALIDQLSDQLGIISRSAVPRDLVYG